MEVVVLQASSGEFELEQSQRMRNRLKLQPFHFFVVAPRVFISMKNHFRVGEPLPA